MTGAGAAGAALRSPWCAVLAGFVARAAAGLALNADGAVHRGFEFYGAMANHVVEGRGLVWEFYSGLGDKWANRGPLYPLFLAGVRAVAGAASAVPEVLAQSAVGALACLVPAAIARRWGGTRAALAAAWIAALWPYWVVSDTGLVEQVVFAPFAGLAVLFALRARDGDAAAPSFAAGACAGLATLARLTFAPAALLLGALACVRPLRLRTAAIFAAGLLVMLLPWVARNHHVTGAWTLGTDTGRALLVGNNPATFASYPAESIDKAEADHYATFGPDEWRRLRAHNDDEVAQDREFMALARAEIAARPGDAAWGGMRKAAALWSPVINPGPSSLLKVVVFGAASLLLLAGAASALVSCPRIRADLVSCGAAALAFTAVAAAFWGQSRYLAPLHGLAIAAAASWLVSRAGRSGAA
jgi:hypothetical protein